MESRRLPLILAQGPSKEEPERSQEKVSIDDEQSLRRGRRPLELSAKEMKCDSNTESKSSKASATDMKIANYVIVRKGWLEVIADSSRPVGLSHSGHIIQCEISFGKYERYGITTILLMSSK